MENRAVPKLGTARERVPGYYRQHPESQVILEVLAVAAEDAAAAFEDVRDQTFVDTATWGLALWEGSLGLATDESSDADERRSVIKAKLRGTASTTAALVQNVAAAYANGIVEVVEYPAEYRLVVKFTGAVGTPPNLDDLAATLDEIIPAHLAWEFYITYQRWVEVKQYTWEQLASASWNDVKEGETGDQNRKL